MPSCLRPRAIAVGSVRSRNRPHFAICAERDPDLLAVHDVVRLVVGEDRGGAQVREVGAGLRFGESLAPVLGRVEDAGQPARLLVLGAPRDDRRADLHDAVRVEDAGRAVLRHHLRVDDLLRGGRGAPAPLLGPEDRGPAALVELVLPRLALVHHAHDAARRVEVFVVGPLLDERRHLLVEERFELLFEGEIFGRPGEVHETDISVRFPVPSCPYGLHVLARPGARCATRCASFLVGRSAEGVRAADGRARRRRHHARGLAQDRRPRLDGPARARGSTAVSASASSTRSSCRRRWAARVFPGPFFSSAILATLAARALGLDDRLAALAAGTRARHGRARRSRLRRSARARARARRRAAAPATSSTA